MFSLRKEAKMEKKKWYQERKNESMRGFEALIPTF
jgi:hypothetical protein